MRWGRTVRYALPSANSEPKSVIVLEVAEARANLGPVWQKCLTLLIVALLNVQNAEHFII
jgi:hypothetical protein